MSSFFCALCDRAESLRISHAMPDTFFRRVFGKSDGKAVVLSNDPELALGNSSDSWGMPMLCGQCEGDMNHHYDRYGVEVLRGRNRNVQRLESGVKINSVDVPRFATFLVSIVWRAALSSHPAYEAVQLTTADATKLKDLFRRGGVISPSQASVKVTRLGMKVFGFSPDDMKQVVVNPTRVAEGGKAGWGFVAEGFAFEVFLPALPMKWRSQPGYLNHQRPAIFAPRHEVGEFDALYAAMMVSFGEHLASEASRASKFEPG